MHDRHAAALGCTISTGQAAARRGGCGACAAHCPAKLDPAHGKADERITQPVGCRRMIRISLSEENL